MIMAKSVKEIKILKLLYIERFKKTITIKREIYKLLNTHQGLQNLLDQLDLCLILSKKVNLYHFINSLVKMLLTIIIIIIIIIIFNIKIHKLFKMIDMIYMDGSKVKKVN